MIEPISSYVLESVTGKDLKHIPKSIEEIYKWILPFTKYLAKSSDTERALNNPPTRFRKRAEYVRSFGPRFVQTMNLKRVARLKTPEAKAHLLALSFGDTKRQPAYAIQKAEETSREQRDLSKTKPIKITPPAAKRSQHDVSEARA